MNYYNYSGRKSQSRAKSRKKKIIINILIIILIIALCAVLALILGNHLKKKLETTELSTKPAEELISEVLEEAEPDPDDEIDFEKNDRTAGDLSAVSAYLDLEGCPDAESAENMIKALKDAGYTGIVFRTRDRDGKYLYSSPAVAQIADSRGITAPVSFENLTAALSAASEAGMKCSAYVELSGTSWSIRSYLDNAVIKELFGLGVREFVLDGIKPAESLDTSFAKDLYGYISDLRAACPGADFGLVIDIASLEDPEATPALELIFRYIEFFALDLRNADLYTNEAISGLFEKYIGSFSAYSLLTILKGDSLEDLQRGVGLFSGRENPNVMFIEKRTDYPETAPDADPTDAYAYKIVSFNPTAQTEPAEDDQNGAGDGDE
ncbi:MAG: hypothetical protein IJT70_08035 [Clostridia bacterium]|nr:hypothetical protein [Clostridia bacterium]